MYRVFQYFLILTFFVCINSWAKPDDLREFISSAPKAHLSLHIEGTLSPTLYWRLAHKHKIKTPYHSLKDVKDKIHRLTNLDDFLALDHLHIQVLKNKRDFYDLTYEMLETQYKQGVKHLEFQFNPENHTMRGVPLQAVIAGMNEAIKDFQTHHNMSVLIISSFLKEETASEIIKSYDKLLKVSKQYPYFKQRWVGVGLDSNEKDNYPKKFYPFMHYARQHEHKIIPHAGHDEPATPYISQFMPTCNSIDRIDHGNMAAFDRKVMARIRQCHIPVALCPLSEIKIGPMKDPKTYPLIRFLENNILVSINADDPAYLNANLLDNYVALSKAQHLDKNTLKRLFINSFKSSLLSPNDKAYWITTINEK